MQINVGTLAGVGKLALNLGLKLGRLVLGSLTLGRNREAVRVVVSFDLSVG
ncbi:MAG TPA: hypothetical protein VGP17_14575 [Solirubrobacteraceae bacterium]|nr:hypothetical protein [Solirubrobacteraceae bacterium]